MPKTRTRKKDIDGLTARGRAFVEARRANPSLPNWKIAELAGFTGSEAKLRMDANRLMKSGAVTRAIFAPRSRAELRKSKSIEQMSEAELTARIKQFYLDLMEAKGVAPGDRIRAATKLGETIRSFFVPLQIDSKQVITLEDLVEGMGGAPRDHTQTEGATQPEAEA